MKRLRIVMSTTSRYDRDFVHNIVCEQHSGATGQLGVRDAQAGVTVWNARISLGNGETPTMVTSRFYPYAVIDHVDCLDDTVED